MSTETHIETLRTKHIVLENQLETEYQRPLPDLAVIQDLKKRKLRLKEEISRLSPLAH